MIVEIGGYVILVAVWSYVRIHALQGEQQTTEAVVYGGLMAMSAVIGSLLIAQAPLPSLHAPVEMIFEPIGKIISKK